MSDGLFMEISIRFVALSIIVQTRLFGCTISLTLCHVSHPLFPNINLVFFLIDYINPDSHMVEFIELRI